jgi:hypothetical protein
MKANTGTRPKDACLKKMDTKRSGAIWLSAVSLLISAAGLYAADSGQAGEPAQKSEPKSVNPPKAAEPMKPGTIDKPAQAVAPGTLDAPPKPGAPGTLDKNVINPDAEIQKGQKPVPR